MKKKFFVGALFDSMYSLLKIVILSSFFKRFKLKSADEIVVLGNGPSLKDFLEKKREFLKGKKTLCVNFFAKTPFYQEVRPDYYVISSPYYWDKNQREDWQVDRLDALKCIIELTDWPMTMIIPMSAKGHKEWNKMVATNPNISLQYFNNTPVEGIIGLSHLFFDLKLGLPRPHNVLVASLYLLINSRFKNIYILGADHSWLQEVYVTDENLVLLSQKHFYDYLNSKKFGYSNAEAKPMYLGDTHQERKLHEVLEKFYYTFRSYWELKEYADAKRVNVFNVTEGSYIDAFERKEV